MLHNITTISSSKRQTLRKFTIQAVIRFQTRNSCISIVHIYKKKKTVDDLSIIVLSLSDTFIQYILGWWKSVDSTVSDVQQNLTCVHSDWTVINCHCLIIIPYELTTSTFYFALPLSNAINCSPLDIRLQIHARIFTHKHMSRLFSIIFFSPPFSCSFACCIFGVIFCSLSFSLSLSSCQWNYE